MDSSIKLAEETISSEELRDLCEWILNGNRLTKGAETVLFEDLFRNYTGSRYAVFVNSGSSANLLMASVLKTILPKKNLKVVAPAVSWVTTVTPFMQLGYEVFLCDADPISLGLDLNELERIFETHRPDAVIPVHVLGHVSDPKRLQDLCRAYDVIVLEDACEALGTTVGGQHAGTFGSISSFSFYYGHHMSTIEGGMLCTDDRSVYEIALSQRSHGWSRDLPIQRQRDLAEEYGIDSFRNLYTFYNSGFNLRATDLQAKLGQAQIRRLPEFVRARESNYHEYASLLTNYWKQSSEADQISSFAYGTLVENPLELSEALKAVGCESRPLICGNVGLHPFWMKERGQFDGRVANAVHYHGIYFPNHHLIRKRDIELICDVVQEVSTPYLIV